MFEQALLHGLAFTAPAETLPSFERARQLPLLFMPAEPIRQALEEGRRPMLTALQQAQHALLKLQSPLEWLQPLAICECNQTIQGSPLLSGMQKRLRLLQLLRCLLYTSRCV